MRRVSHKIENLRLYTEVLRLGDLNNLKKYARLAQI